MNVLLLCGSRNPNGQTAQAAQALLEGVRAGGGQGELVLLAPRKIERCRQCDEQGWGICRTQGQCIIEDDFADLFAKVRAAEVVAFATPVYYGDLSESLRAFLDRLRRTCWHMPDKNGLAGKGTLGICVAGGGGGGSYSCAANLEKLLTTCGLNLLDMIPVRRQNLPMKLAILRATGQWLVQNASQE